MFTTPLALDLAANLLGGLIYFAVARMVSARPVEPSAVRARHAFAAWWYTLGGLAVYGAFADLVTMADAWDVALLVTLTHVLLLVILLALASLLYYLVYLYTGRSGAWKPIFLFYLIFWACLVYWITWLRPDGIEPGALTPRLHYANDPRGGWFPPLLGVLLVLPIIGGAIGYFTLFFKAREPTQRYRIAVVSLSIVLWFSFSLVGSLTGINQGLAWIVVSRAVSIAAAASVYAAYRPPRWVQRRWGVQGVPARA